MSLIGAGQTDVGRKRRFNEDAFAIDLELGLLALADGMGGHAAGEVASGIAIESIREFISRTSRKGEIPSPHLLDEGLSHSAVRLLAAVQLANDRIFKSIESHEEQRGMGTTLVAVLSQEDTACIAHVGDSRAYHYRAGKLTQVTSDHSWVNEQIHLGLLSREEALRHPFRNVITRALGSRERVLPDLSEVNLEPGDRLLLCSDGLTTMLNDTEIRAVLSEHAEDLGRAACELVDRANEAGGEDNVTVIVAGPG